MTLRKYKKVLMSVGFDRNKAEKHRAALSLTRRVLAANGFNPTLWPSDNEMVRTHANRDQEKCGGCNDEN